MDVEDIRRLARYNRWANRRLYGACGSLSEAEWLAPRTGFFPSLMKTLNHILVADRIWLGRIEGRPAQGIAALDQVLHADFAALRAARAAEDERLLALAESTTAERLGSVLSYRTMAGEAQQTPLAVVLTHLFNHQTHHRGQAHAMLSGTAVPPPSLDIIYFMREERA